MIKRQDLSDSFTTAKLVVHRNINDEKNNVYFEAREAVLETNLETGLSKYIVNGVITTTLNRFFDVEIISTLTLNINSTTSIDAFCCLEYGNTTSINLERIKNQAALELFQIVKTNWHKVERKVTKTTSCRSTTSII